MFWWLSPTSVLMAHLMSKSGAKAAQQI